MGRKGDPALDPLDGIKIEKIFSGKTKTKQNGMECEFELDINMEIFSERGVLMTTIVFDFKDKQAFDVMIKKIKFNYMVEEVLSWDTDDGTVDCSIMSRVNDFVMKKLFAFFTDEKLKKVFDDVDPTDKKNVLEHRQRVKDHSGLSIDICGGSGMNWVGQLADQLGGGKWGDLGNILGGSNQITNSINVVSKLMNLVIVESPAKAKTINKYLGKNYIVLASYGHIRDLPSKNGSVDPENKFKMIWEVDSFSKKYLKEIVEVVKDSEKIILATDPDREGEAIAWHVKEYLDEKKLLKDKKIERVVFNEITKKAVTNGIDNPRNIENHLVDAYMARRALDYLVGFNISPILWTKLPGSKSAGRVQSVALKLLTEREHEIELFKPEEFWTLNIDFKTNKGDILNSNISILDGKKIEKFSFKNKEDTNQAIENIKKNKHLI